MKPLRNDHHRDTQCMYRVAVSRGEQMTKEIEKPAARRRASVKANAMRRVVGTRQSRRPIRKGVQEMITETIDEQPDTHCDGQSVDGGVESSSYVETSHDRVATLAYELYER